MKQIKLSFEEIGIGSYLAAKQFKKKYYKAKDNNRFESHFAGRIGEIAYSKYTGSKIDLNHYENCGDGGIDAEDGSQIKTVTWTGSNKQLKIERKELETALKNPNLKRFVLVHVDMAKGGQVVDLIGWISKENFAIKCHTESKWDSNLLLINENGLDHYYTNDTHKNSEESYAPSNLLCVC